MKIGNPADKAVNGASPGGRTEGTAGAARSPGKTESLDGGVEASAKVSLSTLADNLLNGADPAFDAAKVEKVKQSIDNGSYRVDAEVIADKLIANAQELLGRRTT